MASERFDVASARALPGHPWLKAMRVDAAERVAAAPTPDASEEIWRYSRIGELDVDAYALVTGDRRGPAVPAVAREVLDLIGPTAATVVAVDGRVTTLAGDPVLADKGLVVGMLDRDGVLGSVMVEPTDWFADLNTAFCPDPVQVRVPAGLVVGAPIVVVHVIETPGAAVFPRLVVLAGEDSEVTVIDVAVSPDGLDALSAPVTEVGAAPAARVRLLTVNQLGDRTWQVGSLVSSGQRDSTTAFTAVALGGHYARLRIDARLVGQGANGSQRAAYFGRGRQMHDFRTLQDHLGPKTRSELLFKGVVDDHARSVYTGLIKVHPEARGTDAFQTNRNVKLSKYAWAESVPNLEIETNDVRCSHASSVGPVDEDQLFYLESRGVPTETAERLIVLGFLDDVLASLPVPALGARLRAAVAERLERHEAEAHVPAADLDAVPTGTGGVS